MRVDAMMGEAEGEDEKILMIQSLRAMVDGLKRQVFILRATFPLLLSLLAGSCAFSFYLVLTSIGLCMYRLHRIPRL
jgi:hypothetical protein